MQEISKNQVQRQRWNDNGLLVHVAIIIPVKIESANEHSTVISSPVFARGHFTPNFISDWQKSETDKIYSCKRAIFGRKIFPTRRSLKTLQLE